jgi:hypothetical protein
LGHWTWEKRRSTPLMLCHARLNTRYTAMHMQLPTHLNGKSLAFSLLLFLTMCERYSETESLSRHPTVSQFLASLSSPLSHDSKTFMTNRELNTMMHRQLNTLMHRGLNTDACRMTRARTRHVLLPTANRHTPREQRSKARHESKNSLARSLALSSTRRSRSQSESPTS